MAQKRDQKGLPRIYVDGKERGRFEVIGRGGDSVGRLVPTKRSRLVDREFDVTDALRAWLSVWGSYALWQQSRAAKDFAGYARVVGRETLGKLGVDAAQVAHLTQRAKHCDQLRDAFDRELEEAANTYGPLGAGGSEISEIMRALEDLQTIIRMFDPELKETVEGVPASKLPMARWNDAMASSSLEPGAWKCPDLYSALVVRVCTVGDLRFGECDTCGALFIRQRSNRRTCSDRCRQRRRYGQQRKRDQESA